MFLLRIAEAMVASQESFLNSPENAHMRHYVPDDSDPQALHRLADSALNEPMVAEGSEKLSRIKLACSRDSSTPSPSSITTVSVRTHSPSSSNPSPRASVCSPALSCHLGDHPHAHAHTQQHVRPASQNGQTYQGLLYNLLVGGETGGSSTTSTGMARSPLLALSPMRTHTRTSSGTTVPSVDDGSRRLNTDISLEIDERDLGVDKGGSTENSHNLNNNVNGFKLAECTSRLEAVLTASEKSVTNGASCFLSDSSPHHHHSQLANNRNRANSLGTNKLSQLRPYFRPHAVSVGSNGESYHPTLKSRAQVQQPQQQQQRRLLDVNTHAAVKPKLSPRYRSFSKTQLRKQSNCLTRSHSLSMTCSVPGGPTGQPPVISPRFRLQQSLSAPFAQRLVVSGVAPVLVSTRSSGYCSAGLNASPVTSLSTDSGLDEPVDLTGQGRQLNGFHRSIGPDQLRSNERRGAPTPDSQQLVQLAKKTARPVQARVSEWMRQVAEFVALSAPVLRTMNLSPLGQNGGTNGHVRESDMEAWLVLLGHSWHRLLALSMVENAMDLVVVEDTFSDERQTTHVFDPGLIGLPWLLLPEMNEQHGLAKVFQDRSRRADRTFANAFSQFLSEIRQASLSAQEFYLLRHVILLTAHEPLSLPTLGLNVIRASRQVNPYINSNGSVSSSSSAGFGSQVSRAKLKSLPCDVFQTQQQATHTPLAPVDSPSEDMKQSFDLACLACGLKALSVLCPYRMANLFCSHLRTSSTLNGQFLMELHQKFATSLHELTSTSRSDGLATAAAASVLTQPSQLSTTDARIVNGNGTSTMSTNSSLTTSILEQLFDSS